MKRLLSRLLAVLVVVLAAPLSAWAEEDPEDGSDIKPRRAAR